MQQLERRTVKKTDQSSAIWMSHIAFAEFPGDWLRRLHVVPLVIFFGCYPVLFSYHTSWMLPLLLGRRNVVEGWRLDCRHRRRHHLLQQVRVSMMYSLATVAGAWVRECHPVLCSYHTSWMLPLSSR